MGVGKTSPAASCPANCQAVGRVTGFQVLQGGKLNPYLVPRAGAVVAFSIRLGKPDAKQASFFTDAFGGPPKARLSVIRRERRGKVRPYRLVAQSEVFNLSRFLGSTPTFAFSKRLRARRGDVLALTVPTWAPAFSTELGNDDAWRASRGRGACDAVARDAAQQRTGGRRNYDCLYRTARLRYSATFVPDPRRSASGRGSSAR
jgi:hypothetical protein